MSNADLVKKALDAAYDAGVGSIEYDHDGIALGACAARMNDAEAALRAYIAKLEAAAAPSGERP